MAADGKRPDERHDKRQRMRSIAIALALGGLAVLFFFVTIVRLGGNLADKPLQ